MRCRPKNESAPKLVRVTGRSFEQPSPEVCSSVTLRTNYCSGNGTKVRLP